MRKLIVQKILVLILPVLFLFSQVKAIEPAQDSVVAVPVFADTLIVEPLVKKSHSPHKATIYSLVLPGWGQIYNDQWWKVPILYGGFGAATYGIVWNSKNFGDSKDAFIQYSKWLTAVTEDPATPLPDNPAWNKYYSGDVSKLTPQQRETLKSQLQNRKISFKRNRDLCCIVMGAIYALNIIDACVFAHFYDFEIDEDLSMNVRPASSFNPLTGGGTVGLSLTLNF